MNTNKSALIFRQRLKMRLASFKPQKSVLIHIKPGDGLGREPMALQGRNVLCGCHKQPCGGAAGLGSLR